MAWLPNFLTIFRILATPALGVQIASGRWKWAIIGLFVAGWSDWLDGYLARSQGWSSPLGQKLDPIADKFLLITVFVALSWGGFAPIWLALVVIGRDLVILAGAAWVSRQTAIVEFPPRYVGKVSTTFQMVGAMCLIVNAAAAQTWGWPFAESQAIGVTESAIALALSLPIAGATIVSGLDYVALGWRLLEVKSK